MISFGSETRPNRTAPAPEISSSRMSLQSLMHSLQMYTDGPEISLVTSSCPLPQNEQRSICGLPIFFFHRLLQFSLDAILLDVRPVREDLVDNAIFLRFLGRHEVVAVGVLGGRASTG